MPTTTDTDFMDSEIYIVVTTVKKTSKCSASSHLNKFINIAKFQKRHRSFSFTNLTLKCFTAECTKNYS